MPQPSKHRCRAYAQAARARCTQRDVVVLQLNGAVRDEPMVLPPPPTPEGGGGGPEGEHQQQEDAGAHDDAGASEVAPPRTLTKRIVPVAASPWVA